MFASLLKWITVDAFLGSLFWFSNTNYLVLLLLAAWMAAIAVLVHSNLGDRFCWIPVALVLAGVFGSMFVLAIPTNMTLAVNEITLVIFIVSIEVLKKERREPIALVSHRT